MELKSPDFEHNQMIPTRYACDGEDISPELEFIDVPSDAESLVLIMDDPDAPHGTWVHWTVWNIDPTIEQLAAGSTPIKSIEGITSNDQAGYGGPCPPNGTHRYFFRLYALDCVLNVTAAAHVEELTEAMDDHVIAQCELVGLYSKND